MVEWRFRCFLLNRKPGVYVSKRAFVAKTAKFELHPCGFPLGGQIHVSEGAQISDGVILAPYGGTIRISQGVFVGPYCVLYGHGGLTISENTLIAAGTVIVPSNHEFADAETPICNQGDTRLGISIAEDVWIGCGVRILDGVSIGQGCVVGSGAVVTRSLDSYSVAVGVPARTIKKRGH
jgi:acetyltransferase-like isoleucine patch superfamily enzyme